MENKRKCIICGKEGYRDGDCGKVLCSNECKIKYLSGIITETENMSEKDYDSEPEMCPYRCLEVIASDDISNIGYSLRSCINGAIYFNHRNLTDERHKGKKLRKYVRKSFKEVQKISIDIVILGPGKKVTLYKKVEDVLYDISPNSALELMINCDEVVDITKESGDKYTGKCKVCGKDGFYEESIDAIICSDECANAYGVIHGVEYDDFKIIDKVWHKYNIRKNKGE